MSIYGGSNKTTAPSANATKEPSIIDVGVMAGGATINKSTGYFMKLLNLIFETINNLNPSNAVFVISALALIAVITALVLALQLVKRNQ